MGISNNGAYASLAIMRYFIGIEVAVFSFHFLGCGLNIINHNANSKYIAFIADS